MRLSVAPYDRSSRAPKRDFSGSSGSSSSSSASDGSSAPSSIVSWISSSATSGIEYEMQPSPPPVEAPLVIQPNEQVFQQSRPISYNEHYFSQPSYRIVTQQGDVQQQLALTTQIGSAPALVQQSEVPSFTMTVPTPSRSAFAPTVMPFRHSLDPDTAQDQAQAQATDLFTSAHFAQLSAPPIFSPPPMLHGFDFEAAANGAQDEHDAAFWSYFLQPQDNQGEGLLGWQDGESLMLPIEDVPLDMGLNDDMTQQWTGVMQ